MAKEQCDKCKFWRMTEGSIDECGEYTGECKRYPPVLSVLGKEEKEEFEAGLDGSWNGRYEFETASWVQPTTVNSDWCGEFKPAD